MKKHGKTTQVTIDGVNISPHTNNTEWSHEGDSHDITTYKDDDTDTAKEYSGGLTDHTCTISGVYDTDETTGPGTAIDPHVGGALVPFTYAVEGLGAGKPMRTCTVLVTNYAETAPIADMVTWTADLQISGMVVKTTQE